MRGRGKLTGGGVIVAGLALALIVPSVNGTVFDGLPLADPWEALALALLLPFAFSIKLRARFMALLRRRVTWGPHAATAAIVLAIVVKLALLAFGSDQGFVACYASTWQPPQQRCERSYANPFELHRGATRVDPALDFGPTHDRADALITAPGIPVEREGIATTDWDLSFGNDLRFNVAPSAAGDLRALMPFAVSWSGTAAVPDDGAARLTYAGSGSLVVGGQSMQLPPSPTPRTISLRLPPGDQPLQAKFRYDAAYNAAFAEFRLLDATGAPIVAAGPPFGERVAAAAVWLVLAVLFAGLAIAAAAALGRDLILLGLVAVAAVLIALLSDGYTGFQYLAALLAPLMVLRNPRHPVLLAYGALTIICAIGALNVAGDLGAVLYRASGSDFLTYQSYAREIVLGHSFAGGEDVFFYQPGSRYVLGLTHLLLGDGDVLTAIGTMLAVAVPSAALVVWHRKRIVSTAGLAGLTVAGFLLLATINSPTCLSMVAIGASEVPTWALLPLAVAAPQLRPNAAAAWIGSAAAASLLWVMRNNQALAAAAILGSIAAVVGRTNRRLLIAGGAAVLAIALLPAIHNLFYGGTLELTTTSFSSTRVQQIGVGDLPQAFSDTSVGSQIRGHLSAIFYDPPTPGLTESSFGWLLFALLGFWLLVVVLALARHRHDLGLSDWLVFSLPIAFLAPHVIYQVEVYYPRHIVAGYLAMGISAIGGISAISRGRQAL